MKKSPRIAPGAIGLTVLFLLASAWAQEGKPGGGGNKPGGKSGGKSSATISGVPVIDFNEMATVVNLSARQKTTFDQAVEQRRQQIDNFDAANNDMKFKAMKAAKEGKPAEKEQAKRYLEQLDAAKAKLIVEADRKIFDVLASHQKTMWATHVVNKELTNEFAAVGLMPDQEKRIKAIGDNCGRSHPVLYIGAMDNVLQKAKAEVYNSILTKDQQELYVKLKQPTAAGSQQPSGQKKQGG